VPRLGNLRTSKALTAASRRRSRDRKMKAGSLLDLFEA